MANKNVLRGIPVILLLAVILVFGMLVAGCNDESGGNDDSKVDPEITINGWTWETENDSGNGGKSTITMKKGTGNDTGKLIFKGKVVKAAGDGVYGYANFSAVPDSANLTALKSADAVSFKCIGSGYAYIEVRTSDITDNAYFRFPIEFTGTEQTVIIPYSYLKQPIWTSNPAAFKKDQITGINFMVSTDFITNDTAFNGTFEIKIVNIQAGEVEGGTIPEPENYDTINLTANKYGGPGEYSGEMWSGYMLLSALTDIIPEPGKTYRFKISGTADKELKYIKLSIYQNKNGYTSIGESTLHNISDSFNNYPIDITTYQSDIDFNFDFWISIDNTLWQKVPSGAYQNNSGETLGSTHNGTLMATISNFSMTVEEVETCEVTFWAILKEYPDTGYIFPVVKGDSIDSFNPIYFIDYSYNPDTEEWSPYFPYEGYTFDGFWYTDENCTEKYNTPVYSDIDLYTKLSQ
jgi:hypothetical protein